MWIEPEEDINLSHRLNNVIEEKVETTPRQKYLKKMIVVENKELSKNNQTIGNINEVNSIREARAENEVQNIKETFELSDKEIIRFRTKLIVEPKTEVLKTVKNVRKKYCK